MARGTTGSLSDVDAVLLASPDRGAVVKDFAAEGA
jgi:hypothetical protein